MVVILAALLGAALLTVGLVLLVALWPTLWLALGAYRAFGRRTAFWTAAVTLGASCALLETAHGNGPGGLWSWVWFVIPPVAAFDYAPRLRRIKIRSIALAQRSAPGVQTVVRVLRQDAFDNRMTAGPGSYLHRGRHHIGRVPLAA